MELKDSWFWKIATFFPFAEVESHSKKVFQEEFKRFTSFGIAGCEVVQVINPPPLPSYSCNRHYTSLHRAISKNDFECECSESFAEGVAS